MEGSKAAHWQAATACDEACEDAAVDRFQLADVPYKEVVLVRFL